MKYTQTLLLRFVTPVAFLALGFSMSAAGWPARVFAPYVFLGADDHFRLTDCYRACDQQYYTLAFIIANRARQPSWYGQVPMAANLYTNQIAALRARGGDVIVSFGGEDGQELAAVEPDVAVLQADYQGIIERYQLTWLDFDIEGKSLGDTAANVRRNIALAGLQARNPGLIISYTLAVNPEGIPEDAVKLLIDARARGLKVRMANVMTMDYGEKYSAGRKMCDVSIASAIKAHEQCLAIDPDIQIGLTPDIGQNDVKSEIFTLADARTLEKWAQGQPWVGGLSFWCSNRDTAQPQAWDQGSGVVQKPWAFTRIFQKFGQPGRRGRFPNGHR